MKMGLRDLIDVLEEGSGKRSSAKDLIALLKFAKDDGKKKKDGEEKKGQFTVDELTVLLFFAIPIIPLYLIATYELWASVFRMTAH